MRCAYCTLRDLLFSLSVGFAQRNLTRSPLDFQCEAPSNFVDAIPAREAIHDDENH
jgi:hypothetical protein